MMDTPIISVITICYNAIANIEETMLSVLNQRYDKVEYIVIMVVVRMEHWILSRNMLIGWHIGRVSRIKGFMML